MTRPTYMQIDLSALRHNVQQVKKYAPGCNILAMVKANAYGHGMTRVAPALQEVSALGVASIEEAMNLRESGVTQPIILMEGVFSSDELEIAAQQAFILVVHHLPQLEMLEKIKVQKPFSIWLKINTGMHRLGVPAADVPQFYQRLLALDAVKKPIGFMTHFAEADTLDSTATQKQMDLFRQLTNSLPGPLSLANTAGILAWPEAHGDSVRPGLMLYGASPFKETTGLDYGLKPVMTLWSRLISICRINKGGKVGYGGTWAAPEDMIIGVVGAGYGDGYPQFAKNGTPVLVNGKICPLVGRVSMDMLTIDLRQQPEAQIGDKVILWGEGLPVEAVAKGSHSSPYELLTRMTARPKVQIIH